MTELQDRIAEALWNFATRPDNLTIGEEPLPDVFLKMADAVIEALKLHVVIVGDFQTVIKGSWPCPLEEQR